SADAVNDSGYKEPHEHRRHAKQPKASRQPRRESHDEETERAAQKAYHQDRTAPDAIRPLAQNWRRHKLHHRIDSREHTDYCLGCAVAFGIERQHRYDYAEADQINKNGEENYCEP